MQWGKSNASRPERPAFCFAVAVSNLAAATVTSELSIDHERLELHGATPRAQILNATRNLAEEGSEFVTSVFWHLPTLSICLTMSPLGGEADLQPSVSVEERSGRTQAAAKEAVCAGLNVIANGR